MNFITYHYYYYCFSATPVIEDCNITPPLDVTVAPQQYIVNMITSKVPPKILKSKIKFKTPENYSNQNGISCGTPYYFHLGKEMYKYSLPLLILNLLIISLNVELYLDLHKYLH